MQPVSFQNDVLCCPTFCMTLRSFPNLTSSCSWAWAEADPGWLRCCNWTNWTYSCSVNCAPFSAMPSMIACNGGKRQSNISQREILNSISDKQILPTDIFNFWPVHSPVIIKRSTPPSAPFSELHIWYTTVVDITEDQRPAAQTNANCLEHSTSWAT